MEKCTNIFEIRNQIKRASLYVLFLNVRQNIVDIIIKENIRYSDFASLMCKNNIMYRDCFSTEFILNNIICTL